ncbi:MAG: thymidylate synthase [Negativicutes bacterium]|nr:thymidylate synthase [Negativicutes bacterium]
MGHANKALLWEDSVYPDLIVKILEQGTDRTSRAGDTTSVFGEMLKIDISKGLPIMQGRKMYVQPVLGELAALLRGPKSIEDFKRYGCNYWDSWADEHGMLNLDYGNAWRDFNGIDQLKDLVETIKNNPMDRRMLITGWRPDNLKHLSLPCCHLLYQWYVRDDKYLDMIWYQRSVDVMVGLPSDVVLAAVWTALLANDCGLVPGMINMCLGDTHIYTNHGAGALEYLNQLANRPEPPKPVPFSFVKGTTVFNFTPSMLIMDEYTSGATIKFALNV